MSLLRDEDLIAAITVQSPAVPYVEGLALPTAETDRYSKDSPVQASSVDLHIGNIYLPGARDTGLGSVQSPKGSHSLMTGETAVITTAETLHLPNDIAGFGFPPSGVSFKGLLMTNPGHVDPGYNGVMRFTVINMGRDPYPLERGGRIVTLLLFRLTNAVHSSWGERNPSGSSLPDRAAVSRLSRDFVDVERRAKKIANSVGFKWSAGIALVVAVLGIVSQLISNGKLFSRADVEDLRKRQETVEYDLKNRVDVERKIQGFELRLRDLENKSGQRAAQSTNHQNQSSKVSTK